MALKINYKDDIFPGNRQYQILKNDNGTSSFIDVTPYTQDGDLFGALEINAINVEVNANASPVFEDYTGSTLVPDPETALAAIKTKAKLSVLIGNIKAVLKGTFLKKYILTTMEEVMANTVAGRTADALLLKEVNRDLAQQLKMVRYDYTISLTANDDGSSNTHSIDITSLSASHILSVIPVCRQGQSTGIFQMSLRTPFYDIRTVKVQAVTTVAQTYKMEISVFYTS